MADSHDKRDERRAAGAALAGKEIPELREKLGGRAKDMAASMGFEDLGGIAHPETHGDQPKGHSK
jgi:hypothetical protein